MVKRVRSKIRICWPRHKDTYVIIHYIWWDENNKKYIDSYSCLTHNLRNFINHENQTTYVTADKMRFMSDEQKLKWAENNKKKKEKKEGADALFPSAPSTSANV
jgi:hypothetical protein